MCKDTSNKSDTQQKTLFSFPEPVSGKKVSVDFNAPDISANGGLLLARASKDSFAAKIGRIIPDTRNKCLIHHSYEEMVCQRVNQILCGYEDANDCDRLRGDSHFCSPEFMDWAWERWYVRYLTGLSGNARLLDMVDKPKRRAESDFKKAVEAAKAMGDNRRIVIRRYFKLDYKAKSWKHEQRVIAKIEVSPDG